MIVKCKACGAVFMEDNFSVTNPYYKKLLKTTNQNDLTKDYVANFYEILGVERPTGI
ncbi:hypothetical protein R84B8_00949 [Treponema sp. R8-4-B8]